MRTILRLTTLTALVLAAFVAVAGMSGVAQSQAFSGYTSGVQVANLDPSTAANITLTAYDAATGNSSGSPINDTIPVNSSKTYFPISNVSAGFSGSVVVGSNVRVAGISNLLSTTGAGGSYLGRTDGSTTVFLPLLFKNNGGYDTWFSVQNAGTADTTVNISYSDGKSASATIKPGAAKVFYQAKEDHTLAVFAATITSTSQPIVVATIQETNSAKGRIIFAYTGFGGGTPDPVFPLVNANNSGIVTGIQIQNAGTVATEVTLAYTPSSAGTACTEKRTIAPKASVTFAFLAFANGDSSTCQGGQKFVGSARVSVNSANQPLIGIVNQLKGSINGGSYGSFDAATLSNRVVLPLIMDRNGGFYTGFNVMNVGTVATTVTCKFTPGSVTVSKLLQPNEALTDVQGDKLGVKYVGAATCTGAQSTDKLAAIVNQLGARTDVDQLLVYEGTN